MELGLEMNVSGVIGYTYYFYHLKVEKIFIAFPLNTPTLTIKVATYHKFLQHEVSI